MSGKGKTHPAPSRSRSRSHSRGPRPKPHATVQTGRKARAQRRAANRKATRANVTAALVPHQNASGLALTKMMMLPHESQLVRLPTQDMPKVAITRLRATRSFKEQARVGDMAGLLPDTTLQIWAPGQPGLTMMTGPHPLSAASVTTLLFGGHVGVPSTYDSYSIAGENNGVGPQVILEQPWRLVLAKNDAAEPTGAPLRPLLTSGMNFIFMQAGEVLQGCLKTAAADPNTDCELNVTIHQWVGGEERTRPVSTTEHTFRVTSTPPTTAEWKPYYAAVIPGWYAVHYNNHTVHGGNTRGATMDMYWRLNLTNSQSMRVYHLHYAEDMLEDKAMQKSVRRTAYTVLLTNMTAALYKQGAIIAARMDPSDICTPEAMDYAYRLETATDRYVGPAEKGVYTYLGFEDGDDVFREVVNDYGAPLYYPGSSALVPFITVTQSNADNQANSYVITTDIVLEFKTQSQRHHTGVSNLEFTALPDARRINNCTLYFYENPMHWGDILRYAQAAWGGMRKNAGRIGMGLSAVFPEASPAIGAVARYLQT